MENMQIKTFFVSLAIRPCGANLMKVQTKAVRSKSNAIHEARQFVRACPANEDREASVCVYKSIFKLTKNHSKSREKKCAE